ncbi:MAG: dephospho-CoA kinase [Caldisphaera sp.]|uniref:AAA family ATPase n=1 Tax=Caldisphaera sp. TaxID=2060322 RepID=UPI000CB2FCA7|nr:MAG: dephospho-CoA kinase [Caldisphaera sp.]
MKRLAIAITGMPGSGKSVVAEKIAEKLNAELFIMGDIVRDEARRRGIELTIENIENLATQLRQEYGRNAIAKLLLKRIENKKDKFIVIDGIRAIEELKELKIKNNLDICLVSIHASPLTRFNRLKNRKREGEDISWEEFSFRDKKNLEYGIGNVIAVSDFIIINEGSLKELEDKINKVVEVIENEKWENYCRGGAEAY